MANWIKGAIKHPGALHRAVHVKAAKKIPVKTLNRIIKKGGVNARRANLAKTLRKLHK